MLDPASATIRVFTSKKMRSTIASGFFRETSTTANNAQLVERAVGMITGMGAKVIGPAEVREMLNLQNRAPA